ncbi:MAG: hypothetical protein NW218_10970 [Saprospiraceae bacterium]|nr:hypothetical protein [Saprospiraceae bacterium]
MILKILHILMAFNVLLSSSGVTVFEHLCQMKGRTTSFFVQPKNCCQKKEVKKEFCQKSKCCKKAETTGNAPTFTKKPCCEDKSQFFKSETTGTQNKTFSVPDYKFQPLFVEALPYVERFDIIPLNQKILRFYLYKPPPLVFDIRVLVQSFLC